MTTACSIWILTALPILILASLRILKWHHFYFCIIRTFSIKRLLSIIIIRYYLENISCLLSLPVTCHLSLSIFLWVIFIDHFMIPQIRAHSWLTIHSHFQLQSFIWYFTTKVWWLRIQRSILIVIRRWLAFWLFETCQLV